MRKLVRLMYVPVAISLLYLTWTFGTRYIANRQLERAEKARKEAASRVPEWLAEASAVKILHFYATPGILVRGEKAILCYGVLNAKSVYIEPEIEPIKPSLSRCLEVAPKNDARYTLTAQGGDNHRVSASFVIRVSR
jgi:hypothetical protein